MKFSIRDLLWLTVVAGLACLLLVQRQQFFWQASRLRSNIEYYRKRAEEPRVVIVGNAKHEMPPKKRRAIVEFGEDGSVSVRYEEISD